MHPWFDDIFVTQQFVRNGYFCIRFSCLDGGERWAQAICPLIGRPYLTPRAAFLVAKLDAGDCMGLRSGRTPVAISRYGRLRGSEQSRAAAPPRKARRADARCRCITSLTTIAARAGDPHRQHRCASPLTEARRERRWCGQ
jgi:hypothetical protein